MPDGLEKRNTDWDKLGGKGEIIKSSSGPCHLFTIPLKNFNLFKIAELVINFCLKKISN